MGLSYSFLGLLATLGQIYSLYQAFIPVLPENANLSADWTALAAIAGDVLEGVKVVPLVEG